MSNLPRRDARELAAMQLKYKAEWGRQAFLRIGGRLKGNALHLVKDVISAGIQDSDPIEIQIKKTYCLGKLTALLARNITDDDIHYVDPAIGLKPRQFRIFSLLADTDDRRVVANEVSMFVIHQIGDLNNESRHTYSRQEEKDMFALWSKEADVALGQIVEHIIEKYRGALTFRADTLTQEEKVAIKNLFLAHFPKK